MNPDSLNPNSKFQIPNSQKTIFLIGMPGAGKTYWGAEIAKAHDWHFTDLDVFISSHEKASIAALFASYGESGFREREHKHLIKLIKTPETPAVIACGGGTPFFHNNMQLMKDAGTVIYLRADIPELVQNLNVSAEIRPLLKGRGDLTVYLNELLRTRKTIYEQAHYILDAKFISIATFDEIIH